jgi:hypothetical protein
MTSSPCKQILSSDDIPPPCKQILSSDDIPNL